MRDGAFGSRFGMGVVLALAAAAASVRAQAIIVAEGERFVPLDEKGWRLTSQEESFASHAYGGMWVTHGALIGASADSKGSVASQVVDVPVDGDYRVWSKYQSPPYYNYAHRIEIRQGRRKVFSHEYGKLDAPRLYSFFAWYKLPPKPQIWWPWGGDHDAAEAPARPAKLKKGPAELRLIALKNPAPAGERFVDFVLLTTSMEDTCEGWTPGGQVKSPFKLDALHAFPIYMRYKNTAPKPVRARLSSVGSHYTRHGGAKMGTFPEDFVSVGQWSTWFNINRVIEMISDEALQVTLFNEIEGKGRRAKPVPLDGVRDIPIQIALDPQGRELRADLTMPQGETLHVPIDFTWNEKSRIQLSREVAAQIIRKAKAEWRRAAPHKPKLIRFYGAFVDRGRPWVIDLKDAMGYNTLLPDGRERIRVDGYFQHLGSVDRIQKFAAAMTPQKRAEFRVCSLGDEIGIGNIDRKDPKWVEPFRAWLKAKGLTKEDLGGVNPDETALTGNARLNWYSYLFGAEQRFADYRSLNKAAVEAFGPQVLTGANYSPHHGVTYYGHNLQWVDAFKHNAMSMFWTEDYIFSMAEPPQIFAFLFERAHCAVKYNGQPIHMYVMPHAPGQTGEYFRRNMVFAIGSGVAHIDNFWVAPQENFSENFVSWDYERTWKALYESIYDTAAVEDLLVDAKRRPARVAVVTGKATDLNEDSIVVTGEMDPFIAQCHLGGRVTQSTCRKDHQALFLALRNAGYRVDLITEDDIVEGGFLKNYAVVYFAGEWVNHRAVPKLADWVEAGGVLYASTGLGHWNEFREPDDSLAKLLGVQAGAVKKNLYRPRPYLELPLAKPLDTIEMADGGKIEAIAFRQSLVPARDTKVLGKWSDGSVAVTERRIGRGRAIAVGTAAGLTHLKTAVRAVPWARGGYLHLYNPTDFSPAATTLVRLGLEAAAIEPQARCSEPLVEALLLDNKAGTLVTLVNWTNEPKVTGLTVSVKLARRPASVFSVEQQKALSFGYQDGALTFKTNVTEADFVKVMW